MSSKQPRILMVLDAMLVGGTETHVLTLARSLMKRGAFVSVCAGPGALQSEFKKLGCPVHVVPFFGAYNAAKKAEVRQQIGRIIREDDITHMHIHQLHSGNMAFPVARQHRLRVVTTVHGMYYHLATIRNMKRHGATIVAVSPPLRKWVKRKGIRARVIPNGISLQQFYPKHSDIASIRKNYHISPNTQLVVYAGRLAFEKSDVCNRVIDACRNLRDAGMGNLKLVVVGGGYHADTVRRHAKRQEEQSGHDFVTFLGTRKHMRSLYAMADVVVGTGRVALEAMACGKPVVAIGSAGLFGRLKPDRLHAAWHYYFGDHAAPNPHHSPKLERDIRLVLTSPDRQRRYGAAGRAFVADKFDTDRVAGRMLSLYRHTHPVH